LGECTLTQGNYRAKMRIENARRLLLEIGLEQERATIIHFSAEEALEKLDLAIRSVVSGFISLGPNPVVQSKDARREK
jgi:coenzyme F420-reducing hydrogenase delta subunit